MEDCVFCNIVSRKIPSAIEYEDEHAVVFYDIHPKAPIHLLIVPKKHILSVDHVSIEDTPLMGELIGVAKKVARQKNVKGYKILINVGREGGQEIDHLHFHLLANAYGKNNGI